MRPLAEVIAEAFVLEYLQSDVEWIDVREFIQEVYEDETVDGKEVYDNVVGLLEDEAQRFADRNN